MHILTNAGGRNNGGVPSVRPISTGRHSNDSDRRGRPAANLAMLVPLGFLLVAGLTIAARRWSDMPIALAVVGVALLLSWGVSRRARA